jgi:hypothetical protein
MKMILFGRMGRLGHKTSGGVKEPLAADWGFAFSAYRAHLRT